MANIVKFLHGGRFYVGGKAPYTASTTDDNNKFPAFDEGFKLITPLAKPMDMVQGATIKVGPYSVSRGLTVLVGPPAGGKTFFVENKIPSNFLKLKWGEPDSGSAFQDFPVLLDHIDTVLSSKDKAGVIDSIMPLIISSDENLGQGGLSKRVLSYVRQLASIVYDYGGHLVVVANPLEAGAFNSLWANYFKAVAHSVIMVVSQKAALSSRLSGTEATVLPFRQFGGEEGFINNERIDIGLPFDNAKDAISGRKKIPSIGNEEMKTGGGVVLDAEFGQFPQLRGDR